MRGNDSTVSSTSKVAPVEGSEPIAFFDSGVGGLPYLKWAKEHLPGENYVYLLDRANFPYGTKSKEEVLRIVLEGIRRLVEKVNPKIIVLACNTATVVALQKLRFLYPHLPFVGVVPAVKPAAERTHGKRIGVMATNRTLQDAYTENLIKQFAPHCEVVRVAGPGIVEFVEHRLFQSSPRERFAVLEQAITILKERGVDEVVLGCTHFLYLEEELRSSLGMEVELVDSRDGVGRQLIRVLRERSVPNSLPKNPDLLYVTGNTPVEERYQFFAEKFGLTLAGVL